MDYGFSLLRCCLAPTTVVVIDVDVVVLML